MRAKRLLLIALLLAAAVAIYFASNWRAEHPHHAADAERSAEKTIDVHALTAQERSAAVFAQLSGAEVHVLPNGLQLVFIPDPTATVITNMMWYKAGAADDPAGKSGLAHFVEHLTFADGASDEHKQYLRGIDSLEDRQDAVTTYDFTVYFQSVPRVQFETALAIEAHRMARLRINAAPLAAERKEVLDERRDGDADPERALDERIRATLYDDHPYGKPVVGLPREFDRITENDAATFYSRHYGPNNAVMVVHGPMGPADLRPLIERHFSSIPQKSVSARAVPTNVAAGTSSFVVRDNRTKEAVWKRDYLASSYTAGTTAHVYALQVLAELLGGCAKSRLHRLLVEKQRLAKSVHVHYDAEGLDRPTFAVVVMVARGADLDEISKALVATLEGLAVETLGQDLLHAKEDVKAKAAVIEEKMPPAARLVGEALARGRTLHDLKEWPRRIDAVNADDVRAAAKVLLRSPSVTGVLTR